MVESKHDKYFSRNMLMIQKLSQEGSVSVAELAEEFNCAVRTIYRDIEKLHFFPLELNAGVVSIAEGFSLGQSNLQENELLIAELAFSAIEDIDTRTHKHIQAIRSKLSYPLFFTPYTIKAENFEPIKMDSELLNKMEDAITKNNVSKITSHTITSRVEPYKIVAFDGFWYLLAKDLKDQKIKTYLIAHVSEFRATTEVFAKTNIDKILENVHTAWFADGNSFEVKIKVKPQIAHYFKLKKHLTSQNILKENNDGSLIVSFEVSSDEDVDNLIKSWLPHIEVIKPARFRKKMILELEEYVKELKQLHYEF
ncbi:MAG: WYL domain-containing protein [Sulfurimonas sp.]|nr:WYL domain-containing protein [Sulfurimonas sp.]MBU3938049.1 WYL domain-containing protein [bacterium]MBU4024138.1 WYL domain-containing protein [bacterium]